MEDLKRLLERMDEKIEDVRSDISEIKVVQGKQASDLEHHIFRTGIAEQRIEMLQVQLDPLSKFHMKVEGAFKLIGIVATGLGLIVGAGKIILALF